MNVVLHEVVAPVSEGSEMLAPVEVIAHDALITESLR
jgi:hypothetical protein